MLCRRGTRDEVAQKVEEKQTRRLSNVNAVVYQDVFVSVDDERYLRLMEACDELRRTKPWCPNGDSLALRVFAAFALIAIVSATQPRAALRTHFRGNSCSVVRTNLVIMLLWRVRPCFPPSSCAPLRSRCLRPKCPQQLILYLFRRLCRNLSIMFRWHARRQQRPFQGVLSYSKCSTKV